MRRGDNYSGARWLFGRRRPREDPVPPELARYIFGRDGGCLVAILDSRSRIRGLDPICRDRWGTPFDGRSVPPSSRPKLLTIAHVRDRAGGRAGKRPPSVPRRLVAVCYGHHLDDPVVDRADVRPEVDRYLEEREGEDIDRSRPWERVRRVRARAVDSGTSERTGGP